MSTDTTPFHAATTSPQRPREVDLLGLAWDNPRGYGPLKAAEEAFASAHPGLKLRVHWDVQPLAGFESRSIVEAAQQYDLIVMDHPHVVEAANSACLLPIDDVSSAHVGKSRHSYRWNARHWAAPIDAACHVAAFSADAVPRAIDSWDELFAAAEDGLRLAAPLKGVHSLMAFLTLVASQGVDVGTNLDWLSGKEVESALFLLRRLCDIQTSTTDSAAGLDWNPIDALQALAQRDCDYLPLTFGYAEFARQGVRFGSVPAMTTRCRPRGVLGGAGLAVSAKCGFPEEAIKFARFLADEPVQTKLWPQHGGQPAHQAAWECLAQTHAFYRDTREAMDQAFVRPRGAHWNAFQSRAGSAIEDWLRARRDGCQTIVEQLRKLAAMLS